MLNEQDFYNWLEDQKLNYARQEIQLRGEPATLEMNVWCNVFGEWEIEVVVGGHSSTYYSFEEANETWSKYAHG